MKEVVTTDFQTDILETAALMIQPFDVSWLAKAIRKPRRGVINQIGRLRNQGVLAPGQAAGFYWFVDNSDLENIETGISDSKKIHIYNNLWHAIQNAPSQKSSTTILFQKLWAALKADAPAALILASDALKLSFHLVDDTLADSIFALCREKWPEEFPKSISLRKAEYEFLKGDLFEAQCLIDSLLNDRDILTDIKKQAEILKIRICIQKDINFFGVEQLQQLIKRNVDSNSIHDLLVHIIECYQESGCGSAAETLLDTFHQKESPNNTFEAEFLWLRGRHFLLKGDSDKALQYFQKALIKIEKHINRSLAACIMMDVARLHGIQGNTIREHNCLRLVERLVQKGKREYLRGKLNLYVLEGALESGNLKEAGNLVYKILNNFLDDFGRYNFAVALYGGLVLATRLNLTEHAASYLNELSIQLMRFPLGFILRIYYTLNDLTEVFPDQCADLQKTIKNILVRNYQVYRSSFHESEIFEITYSKAAFLRQSQLVSDLLAQEFIDSDKQDHEKFEQALWLAQTIGDQKRCADLKPLRTQQQNSFLECDKRQYSLFAASLLSAETYEQYLGAVQAFFSANFGIESGIFLVNRESKIEWVNGWGDKPRLKEQRAVVRAIERTDRINRKKIIAANPWIGISFPTFLRQEGYLLLNIDGNNGILEKEKLFNFLIKPIAIMRQVLVDQTYRTENIFLPATDHADKLIGKSLQIQELRNKIRRIANSPTTVHISGETGTGKELIAEAIHYCGSRKDRPFVPFNCSTTPDTLIESELFGHKRGAYTGAVETRKGVFELAHGGTIFLDEIADLPISVQAKLLRVLQERKIRPLGSEIDLSIDVRIISATHKNLDEEVRKGHFRSDLFYRLVVLHLHAPPLRERSEDIPVLAVFFLESALKKIGLENVSFTHNAIKWLASRYWSGNVRELQNLIEAAANFVDTNGTIDVLDLKKWVKSTVEYPDISLAEATEKYQVELIRKILDSCDGNVTQSAKKLGITRQTLNKKLKNIDLRESDTL